MKHIVAFVSHQGKVTQMDVRIYLDVDWPVGELKPPMLLLNDYDKKKSLVNMGSSKFSKEILSTVSKHQENRSKNSRKSQEWIN